MEFEASSRITHPPALCCDVMLRRIEEIVPFMENVAEIKTESMEDKGDGRVEVVRWWLATAKSAPKLLRPFVSKKNLWWRDYAVYYLEDHRVEWSIETNQSKMSQMDGTTIFEPHPDAPETETLMTLRGDLRVFGDRLPGVPAFLGNKLAPRIERIIVKMMAPNLAQNGEGLQKLIDAQVAGE